MKTNTIITIGRQFGSAGREIGYQVADYFGIKLYDKEMLSRAAKKVVSAKKSLKRMMKNQRTVFCIPWLWIHIPWDIQVELIQICRLTIKYFLRSLMRSKR